jgi:1-acyl-sn-glycerol-3-phosphate acyltransferase
VRLHRHRYGERPQEGPGRHRAQPQELLGPVLRGHRAAPAGALHGEGRALRRAGIFLRLGAFPVRRGESDAEALDTARAILARGDALALFPEGTRVREEGLGTPKRGAARLAIEAGAPIVPATITGTEKRRWPLPRKVRMVFGTPVSVEGLEATPEDAAAAIGEAWPQVTEEYHRWQNRAGLITAGAAAVGLGAWVVKKRRNAG